MSRLMQRAAYDKQNIAAAQIIAADPARYPGVMQQWARLVMMRLGYLVPEQERAA